MKLSELLPREPRGFPPRMTSGQPWPKLTVITPSFNQGAFLEQTIRSVLSQGYPNLEYLVFDGGSSDGSLDILKKYADKITFWTSEKDSGQANALNKGLKKATGSIVCYMNSDDVYLPGAFERAVQTLGEQPETKWMCGSCWAFQSPGDDLVEQYVPNSDVKSVIQWLVGFDEPGGFWFPSASCFIGRALVDKVGFFDERFQVSFDFEYYCRLRLAGYEPLLSKEALSAFRLHGASKTSLHKNRFYREDAAAALSLSRRIPLPLRLYVQRRAGWKKGLYDLYELGESPKAREMLALAKRNPLLLVSRAYWGKVRRCII